MPSSYSRTENLKWAGSSTKHIYYRSQVGWKTTPGDRRKPLAYEATWSMVKPLFGGTTQRPDAWFHEIPTMLRNPVMVYYGDTSWRDVCSRTENKCRARFVEAARAAGKAAIGETLAQSTDLLGTITKRAEQLIAGAKALRQRNLRKFFATFGVPTPVDYEFRPKVRRKVGTSRMAPPPGYDGWDRWGEPSPRNRWVDRNRYKWATKRLKAKDPAAVWLEYWFVWAPTVNDIHQSLVILCDSSPPHGQRVTASATGKHDQRAGPNYISGQLFKTNFLGQRIVKTKFSAEVTCLNPNRQLYDILGVSNAPLVLWWMFPFSFLADWVVNVGEVLESFQDTMDWILSDSVYTNYRYVKGTNIEFLSQYSGTASEFYRFTTYYVKRQVGIGLPPVKFIISLPNMSLTRAATAISLLATQLRSI